jgi:hypothetical protein
MPQKRAEEEDYDETEEGEGEEEEEEEEEVGGSEGEGEAHSSLPDLRPYTKRGQFIKLMTLLDSFTVNGTEVDLSATDAAIALHCFNRAARIHFGGKKQQKGKGEWRGGDRGDGGKSKAERAMYNRLFFSCVWCAKLPVLEFRA